MKSKKNAENGWQWALLVTSVCALSFWTHAWAADGDVRDEALFVRLREAEMARQEAEEQALALNARLLQAEKQLSELRAALAEQTVVLQQLRDERVTLRLHAAQLLLADGGGGTAEELAQLLSSLRDLQQSHRRAYQGLGEFQSYLESMLDVLDPKAEAAHRRILDEKLVPVFRELERAERFFYAVEPAVKDTAAAGPRSAAVVKVDDELQVVILDRGRQHGIRPGMVWMIRTPTKREITVRTIETRRQLSAALVIKGDLRYVLPGLRAQLRPENADDGH
jgi:hypothetical protein